MDQFDSVLKSYAEAGMKTAEDWALSGRHVVGGSKPRADVPHRGGTLSLYSRDQTQIKSKMAIS